MTRQQANRQLIRILTEIVETCPDLRFSQILSAFGFVRHTRPIKQEGADLHRVEWLDEFYKEPQELLERVESQRESLQK
jgi:hypothetical protein